MTTRIKRDLPASQPILRRPLDEIIAILITAVLLSTIIACTAIAYNPQTGALTIAVSLSTAPTPARDAPGDLITTKEPPATPHETSQPTPPDAKSPTPTPEPTAELIVAADHYWFERPIESGKRNYVSRFYPYGGTYRGRYQVHHGVEFENPAGTPILAVGAGEVIVAGPDTPEVYGRFPDFYGMLVVIKHNRMHFGRPVFTLYGHMSSVEVKVGDIVETGQIIGAVGSTGVALGPHLHMEVRVGANTYASTRNPELWIKPFKNYGTIAGRLVDSKGNFVPQVLVALYNSDGSWRTETETYGQGANPDEGWQENFVFGDVPVGRYTVQYVRNNTIYADKVMVESGRTSFATLELMEEE